MPIHNLAQVLLPATLTDVLSVPASSPVGVKIVTLVVMNMGSYGRTFSISHAVGGVATSAKQYLIYNKTVNATASDVMQMEIGLAPGDVLRAMASAADEITLNVYGE